MRNVDAAMTYSCTEPRCRLRRASTTCSPVIPHTPISLNNIRKNLSYAYGRRHLGTEPVPIKRNNMGRKCELKWVKNLFGKALAKCTNAVVSTKANTNKEKGPYLRARQFVRRHTHKRISLQYCTSLHHAGLDHRTVCIRGAARKDSVHAPYVANQQERRRGLGQ